MSNPGWMRVKNELRKIRCIIFDLMSFVLCLSCLMFEWDTSNSLSDPSCSTDAVADNGDIEDQCNCYRQQTINAKER